MTGLVKGRPPYVALATLANTGPMLQVDLEMVLAPLITKSKNPRAGYHIIRTLLSKGLVKEKLWLTPEGLAELQMLGWEPER